MLATLRLTLAAAVVMGTQAATFAPPRFVPAHFEARRTPLVYVADGWITSSAFIGATAYPLSANGAPAPTIALGGSQTGFVNEPSGVAVAPDGTLAVILADGINNDVAEFAPGANGNAPRSATIQCGGLDVPNGATFDANGTLYVASFENRHRNPSDGIAIFPPGSHGCVSGNHVIIGAHTGLHQVSGGIAVHNKHIFVADEAGGVGSILVFPVSANGDVAPSRVITGPNTGLFIPNGVAVNRAGEIVVADYYANTISIFAPAAHGNATPSRVIGGTMTLLDTPTGVAVSRDGLIFVANNRSSSITVYAPDASGNVPPVQYILGGDANSRSMLGTPNALAILN